MLQDRPVRAIASAQLRRLADDSSDRHLRADLRQHLLFQQRIALCAGRFLQLAALHLLLLMNGKASVRLALALEAVLTAAYLSRINLILFIARALAIGWVRAGRDRWRVYAASADSSRRSRSICTSAFAAASYVSASRCAGRATRHWPRAGWLC
jgi:hypothetical protein